MGIRRKLRQIRRWLSVLNGKVNVIMATQKELAAALDVVNDKLVKIGTETNTLLAAIADLKVQLANAPVSAELQAAFDKVAAQADVVDALVPDAP